MSFIAAATIVGGASLVGGYMQAQGAKNAAQIQADANARAQEQLLATGKQDAGLYQPYQDLGQTGVNAFNANMPYLTNQFSNADLNSNLAPNYGFMLQQGQGANLSAANATGGMVGGNALQGLQNYTQNFAGNAYQNAFTNYQNQQNNIFNRLSGIAGIGQAATTGAANAMLGTGTNVASLTQGIGQAQAAGQIGQANAYGNALSGVGNAGLLYGMNQAGQGGGTGLSAPGGFNQSGVQTINGMANPNFVGPVP